MPHIIRALQAGDRDGWTGLWKAYLAFYETVLPDEVYASTWSRLLDPSEPTWGALALRDGQPVGLVHWLYHRTNWSVSDNCYLQDLFVAPDGRGQGHGRALSMSPPTRQRRVAQGSIGPPIAPITRPCSSMTASPASPAFSNTA